MPSTFETGSEIYRQLRDVSGLPGASFLLEMKTRAAHPDRFGLAVGLIFLPVAA
jgi:hypothetical protein